MPVMPGPERYGYNSTDVIYNIFSPFATDKTAAVEKTLQIRWGSFYET